MAPLSNTTIFAGTSAYAVPVFDALHQLTTIVAVITKDPSDDIALRAQERGIPVLTPSKITDITDQIRTLAPDLMVVAHYGHIIPQSVLDIPRFGSINIHPSLLPQHRGPAPVPNTILAGDQKTGTTIIQMDDQMDHGPIIAQSQPFELHGDEYADDLLSQLWSLSADLLKETLPSYLMGKVKPTPQDHSLATKHSFMKRTDGELQSIMRTEEVFRRHRAYRPWPGTYLEHTLRGANTRIKFIDMQPSTEQVTARAGEFVWHNQKLYFGFSDGAMQIRKLQRAGSPVQTAETFYRGFHDCIRTQ